MPLFADAIANLRRREARQPSDWSLGWVQTTEGSVTLADGLTESYTSIYRKQPWVYAAVNKLSRSVARMPIKAYERDENARRRAFDGPLPRLMNRPQPRVTGFHLRERIVKNVAVYGNAIVVKMGMDDNSDTPTELLLAPATGWAVGADDTYIWTARNGDRYVFDRWQIIHFRFWDLDESGFGMSMLEPLRMTLALEDAAQRYGVAAFRNAARPGSVLRTDSTLSGDAAKALKSEMVALHGGVDKAFQVAVLQGGLDFATIEHDLSKAAVVEHRKLTREEVAAVLDLPQPTIGILDESNFASIDMLHTMLYQDSLGPWVAMIEQTLQAELVDPTPAFAGQFLEFDMNAVLRGDIGSRYRAYATAITTGFKTPDEIRALENDPPMADVQPEAGRLLFPMNLSGAVGADVAEASGQEDDTDA